MQSPAPDITNFLKKKEREPKKYKKPKRTLKFICPVAILFKISWFKSVPVGSPVPGFVYSGASVLPFGWLPRDLLKVIRSCACWRQHHGD